MIEFVKLAKLSPLVVAVTHPAPSTLVASIIALLILHAKDIILAARCPAKNIHATIGRDDR